MLGFSLSDMLPSLSLQSVLVFGAMFLLAYNYLSKEAWRRLPPGPPTLPLLGSMPFLGSSDIRRPLMDMARKYGNVFTIYMGTKRVVVLNGYDVTWKAFVKMGQLFSDRPSLFFITHITQGYGIVSVNGEKWKEQRRHSLHILRDFGFGRTILEDRILEEISFFVDALRSRAGVPCDPQQLLQSSIANVISLITFGKRQDYEDPTFIKHMEMTTENFELVGNSGPLTIFPILRHCPGDPFRYKRLMRNTKIMIDRQMEMIREHVERYDPAAEPEDFIDAYLAKMKLEENNPNTNFTERQLLGVVGDLYGAGFETSTTTLSWAIIYMTLNTEIQAKVQAEIDDVIGPDDVPRMCHRSRLPYTEACISEIQRLGDIVPLGVPHATTEDVEFEGYCIPRGTMVICNMYSVHMDPEVWPDPHKFDPTRFLDDDGKLVKRDELIPFSLGKRVCLGESLARMELFLYFVSMLQKFRFCPSPDHPLPDTKGILGITNMPKPFHVLTQLRN